MSTLSSSQAVLQQVIEGLYVVFDAYPLSSLEGCPCCVSAADKGQIAHRALRELTQDDLGRYAGKAMTTWGTVDDFKHFLPRLFELTAAFQCPYEEYVVFGKLAYGQWRTWPPAEIAVIEHYFLALWDVVLRSDTWDFRNYFIALTGIYPRFDELLQQWQACPDPKAWAFLGEEIYDHHQALFRDQYFNGPFLESPQLSQRFRMWVVSPAVRDKLLETFSRCSEEVAEQVAGAYDLIEYELRHRR